MNDKGKPLFMRIVNEITSIFQSIEDRKLQDGDDHSEFLCWNGSILETHSSVYGSGVRSMNFVRWCEREGLPNVVILRPSTGLDSTEVEMIHQMMAELRGIEYNLKRAINSRLGKDTDDSIEAGLFCSEITLLLAGFQNWLKKWPREAREMMIEDGYFVIFEGEAKDLLG